jgi:hypothetical protein
MTRPNKNAPASVNPTITLNDLLRRWGKFDEAELTAITSNAELVTQIQKKYGLDAKQAQTNVDLWAEGREL